MQNTDDKMCLVDGVVGFLLFESTESTSFLSSKTIPCFYFF